MGRKREKSYSRVNRLNSTNAFTQLSLCHRSIAQKAGTPYKLGKKDINNFFYQSLFHFYLLHKRAIHQIQDSWGNFHRNLYRLLHCFFYLLLWSYASFLNTIHSLIIFLTVLWEKKVPERSRINLQHLFNRLIFN